MNNELESEELLDNETEVKNIIADFENIGTEDETEKDRVTSMGEFIRENSFDCKITNAEDFLEEPFLLDVDEILPLINQLEEIDEFKDIFSIKGDKTIYLFSEKYISHNYAKMMIMVEEKDLLKLVVETVRQESKTYPRPTDSRLFSHNPFKLSKEELDEVLVQLKRKEEYSDIKETVTSNKALYLYSDKFMTKTHASSLAEWVEVERHQNP